MIAVITFCALAALTHALAGLLVKGDDRRWVSTLMLAVWCGLFLFMVFISDWFPFTGGGDDEDYFAIAATQFTSLADYFDMTRFIGSMEQPGYPWLLSILYQFTGQDLIAFKLLNVAFFVMLIPIWYCIGSELESRMFGRALALAICFMTPLWYYGFFVLKDMAITLLQSMFLFGVVRVVSHRGSGLTGWLLCLGSTVALLPFRSQLVVVNVAVLLGSVILVLCRRKTRRTTVTALLVGLGMLSFLMVTVIGISSNPDLMAGLGIVNEQRVIGSVDPEALMIEYAQASEMKRVLFPLLYLVTETAGLNLKTWANFDAITGLRSVLALPWIFLGVPFFAIGLLALLRPDRTIAYSRGLIGALQSTRGIRTAWGAVLMFILAYMAVAWTAGDTTRWRVPDLPAMAAIAVFGWSHVEQGRRRSICVLWIAACSSLFALFNMF